VDVVILAMDRVEETEQAIRSALSQRGVSRHVFVIDQGSQPDNLARLAACVAQRLDATLVRLDRNYGVAGGRNRGSALGHGRIIVALDNDAEFQDGGTLARAVAAIEEDRLLAAIGFRIVIHADGSDDLSSWGYPSSLLPRAGERFDAVTFVGAGHAIRRRAWLDAGGYDDALFFCWEEYDFCLRAINRGWRVGYRGDIVIRHKVSAERRFAWSGTRWFYFVRNRLYIGHKFGESWLALAPRYLAYLVKGVRNGVGRQTLRALPAALRLTRATPPRRLTREARNYLSRNDRAHRGSLFNRLRSEVLAALPGRRAPAPVAQPRERASRSRNSIANTGGLSSR
jgi:GT2 family glycosyltransferase